MIQLRLHWRRHWSRYLIAIFVLFQFGDVFFAEGTLNTLQQSPATWVYKIPEYHSWLEDSFLNRFPSRNTGHRALWDRPLANDPVIKAANELLLKGEFPWLNPYLGLGIPLFGDGIAPIFFIGNLFFMFINSQYWDWFYLGLFFLSGWFLLRIFHYYHLDAKAALIGSLTYLSSGLFAPQMTYMNAGEALNIYLFVFGIYFIERFRLAKRWYARLAGAFAIIFCLTQTVYAAFPESTVANFFMLCAYLLLRLKLKPWYHLRQSGLWIFFIFFIALLLSAPYLLVLNHNADLMLYSHKVGHTTIALRYFPELFLPYFRGSGQNDFFPFAFPNQLNVIFIGVLPLIAILLAGCHLSKFWNKQPWIGFFLIFVFYLSQSFGPEETNLNFVGLIPIVDRIWFWRFFSSLYVFAACLLTAKVLHHLLKGKLTVVGYPFIGLLWSGVLLYYIFYRSVISELAPDPLSSSAFFQWNQTNTIFVVGFAILFSLWLPWIQQIWRGYGFRKMWGIVLVAAVFMYSSYHFSKNFFHKQDAFAEKPVIAFLKQKLDNGELFRVYSPNQYYPSTMAGYGIPDLRFLVPIAPKNLISILRNVFGEYARGRVESDGLQSLLELDGGNTYNHPGFDLLNVRYFIFHPDHKAMPTGKKFREIFRNKESVIIENLDAKARFFLVSEWEIFSYENPLLQTMVENPQGLFTKALLLDPPVWPDLEVMSVSDNLPPRLITRTNHSYRLDIHLKDPHYLVISDTYYEGHYATILGQRLPVQQVNGGMIGVAIPAGHYHLYLRFEHPFFLPGLLLFILGILMMVILAFVVWKKHSSSIFPLNPGWR